MTQRPPHLWAVVIKATLEGFAQLGIDIDEVCQLVEIDRVALDDPDYRVPFTLAHRMWEVADELWGKPALGLYTGARVPFGAYHTLDYLLATGASIAEGIDALLRYYRVVSEGATQMELIEAPGGMGLAFSGPVPLQVRDYMLSFLGTRLRQMGADVLEARFFGPSLGEPREYARIFGAPAIFNQPQSALVFTSSRSRKPDVGDYPGLREIIVREADRMLGELETKGETADVRAAIVALLPKGRLRIDEVAKRLHLSVRTLQRRLREQGWTFGGLVDAVRADLARQHLAERQLSAAEVAYLVGFADPASFSRACVRWFGKSPAKMRRRRSE